MFKNFDFQSLYKDYDSLQFSPKIVIGVVRYAYKNTYDFVNQTSIRLDADLVKSQKSAAKADAFISSYSPSALSLAPKPTIPDGAFFSEKDVNSSLTGDNTLSGTGAEDLSVAAYSDILQIQKLCTNVNITSSKSSHNTTLAASFIDAENVLMRKITPGDWIFVSIVNNEADLKILVDSIQKQSPINDPELGLKFLGKVHSIVKTIQVSSEGFKRRGVNIQAFGFKEFDSMIFYDPKLLILPDQTTHSLIFGITDALSSLRTPTDPTLMKTVNWVPSLMRCLLGEGPPNSEKNKDVAQRTYNRSYLVPKTIGKLLGVPIEGSNLTYSSILYSIIGIQNFKDEYMPLLKDAEKPANKNDLFCTKTMDGVRFDAVQPWQNVPIWNIITGYCNSAVEEVFTCLKVLSVPDPNNSGQKIDKILPTLIYRQIPLTTPFLQDEEENVTRFFDLPRWIISDKQVMSMEVGRSESYRVNNVEVVSQLPIAGANNTNLLIQKAYNVVRDDFVSVQRDGLRIFSQTVNVESQNVVDNGQAASRWSALCADRLMSGHLRYSGSFTLKGIQQPICVGDNLEFNDIVYHIENISHTVSTDGIGNNVFITNIDVTNGLNKNYTNHFDIWPETETTQSLKDLSQQSINLNYEDQGPTGVVE